MLYSKLPAADIFRVCTRSLLSYGDCCSCPRKS